MRALPCTAPGLLSHGADERGRPSQGGGRRLTAGRQGQAKAQTKAKTKAQSRLSLCLSPSLGRGARQTQQRLTLILTITLTLDDKAQRKHEWTKLGVPASLLVPTLLTCELQLDESTRVEAPLACYTYTYARATRVMAILGSHGYE